jgi:TRAP-type transport system small permease protein
VNENASKGPNLGDPLIGSSDQADDVDLSQYGIEDWVAFGFFWSLAIVVFLQFFTRYVLNDSLAWTEEIARYQLICVAFVGAAMASRRQSHIVVEFLYVYMGRRVAFTLSTLVDVIVVLFYAYAAWLGWEITKVMETQRMVVIDLPMSYVFGTGALGLALMAVRSVQVGLRHWREGVSPLTRVHDEGRHT